MRKTLLTLFFLTLIFSFVNAQVKEIETISAGGGSSKNENLELSWTLGQLVIVTGELNENSVTQGFHQTIIQITITNLNDDLNEFQYNVFPNPVDEVLTIEFPEKKDFEYSIFNENGELVISGKLTDIRNHINLSQLYRGTYILYVKDQNSNKLSSYKISKL
jgi:hypothetical protein